MLQLSSSDQVSQRASVLFFSSSVQISSQHLRRKRAKQHKASSRWTTQTFYWNSLHLIPSSSYGLTRFAKSMTSSCLMDNCQQFLFLLAFLLFLRSSTPHSTTQDTRKRRSQIPDFSALLHSFTVLDFNVSNFSTIWETLIVQNLIENNENYQLQWIWTVCSSLFPAENRKESSPAMHICFGWKSLNVRRNLFLFFRKICIRVLLLLRPSIIWPAKSWNSIFISHKVETKLKYHKNEKPCAAIESRKEFY